MKSIIKPLILSGLLAAPALARDVPSNVRNLYNSIVGQGFCKNKLQTGFYSVDHDTKDFSYCGDHLSDYGIMYIQGNSGQLTNMDIDCDGVLKGGDGSCGGSTDTQSETAFRGIIASYKKGISDMNAYVHNYVVLGNNGKNSGFINFNPQQYGIHPLSVVAVVCGNKMFYGIWGDTDGGDGPPMVGEASVSMGQLCYGNAVNGNSGHDQNDVLYIAFTGDDAVPGANGANWAASNAASFESSLEGLGNRLIQRITA